MANRFWSPVGAANWGDANVWATTEGGVPTGIATPTNADDVYFTSTNNNNCVQASANTECLSLSFNSGTGKYTGTFSGSDNVKPYGSLLLSSTMTMTHTGLFNMQGTGSHTINFDGITHNGRLFFYGSGTFTLTSAINTGSENFVIVNSTIDTNEQTITCTDFTAQAGTAGLDMTNSTINVSGDCDMVTGMAVPTITGSTIVMSGAGGNFDGGGLTFNDIQCKGGISNFIGSNTFSDIFVDTGDTAKFTAGTTTTLTTLTATGAGTTITSITAATHTLSSATALIEVENCTISYSIAQGGAAWHADVADGNVDGGNNTGWSFIAPATDSGNMFLIF